MKNYFDESEVVDLFCTINKPGIEYILLRNINKELPSNLPTTKDIDIIVAEDSLIKFEESLFKKGWERIIHPYVSIPFLYAMKPFRFYNKEGLHVDVCCQLACRSLNEGEWFPLDAHIQDELWKNKIKSLNQPWLYQLSHEDELIHLITRCVFDKKKFPGGYISRIDELMGAVNVVNITYKLSLIFFKFTNTLLELIREKQYNNIYQTYLQFKEY